MSCNKVQTAKLATRGQIPAISDDDIFHLVDVSDTTSDPTGTSRYSTIAQLASYIGAGGDAAPKFREEEELVSTINPSDILTIPNSRTYTLDSDRRNMLFHVNGTLMGKDDYDEVSTTTIRSNRKIKSGDKVTYIIFK